MGVDPATGLRRRASFTHHGDAHSAASRQVELVARYGVQPAKQSAVPAPKTMQALLTAFMAAEHEWSASTRRSHGGEAAVLSRDPIGLVDPTQLGPGVMERTMQRWAGEGLTVPNLGARFRVLHAAITWGLRHQLLADNPLAGMKGPARPAPRQQLPPSEVRRLIQTAAAQVASAREAHERSPHDGRRRWALFLAEQNELLVRLDANTGLTRGELAALHTTDLVDRTLRVERTSSDG